MITRRSLLTGLAASTLIVAPAAQKIVRAAELSQSDGRFIFTSSWLEEIERHEYDRHSVWRQKSYRFKAATAPKILVINAAPDAHNVAGVQLDWAWDRIVHGAPRGTPESPFSAIPSRTDALGWIRGTVDVTNTRGVEIELTSDESFELIRRQRSRTIEIASTSDLFCLTPDEGEFVIDQEGKIHV
jgi:hypothetical protein